MGTDDSSVEDEAVALCYGLHFVLIREILVVRGYAFEPEAGDHLGNDSGST